MVSFNIFSRKATAKPTKGFAFLKADMHSHLVPAIDDGADSVETSLSLLEGLEGLGFEKAFTTPHVRSDYFPNTRAGILEGAEKMKGAMRSSGLSIRFSCAAEYHVDHVFAKRVEDEPLLTLPGNQVLFELSTFSPPPNLYDVIFQMKIKGYQPVLAHPERYVYFSDIREFKDLREAGCHLQLNILSITGHYGKPVKELALQLLQGGLIDFLGTDIHHRRHLDLLNGVAQNRSLMRLFSKHEYLNEQL